MVEREYITTDISLRKLCRKHGISSHSLVVGEPAWRLTPKDLALLLDRLQVLFARPSSITQHQGVTVTSELSADAQRGLIEATRGVDGTSRMEVSPLPRTRRLDD